MVRRTISELSTMGALVIVVAAVFAIAGCTPSPSDGFTFLPADEVGVDPFTTDVASPAPVEFVELREELAQGADAGEAELPEGATDSAVQQARFEGVRLVAENNGISVLAPASPRGVGLYGGSGTNACDVQGLVGFLSNEPEKAREWARVQGIDPDEIDSFAQSLVAGFLLDDARVTNHTFVGGVASPIQSTLEAGSAVLVDAEGVPRVRCKCGNPLRPAGVGDFAGLWIGDWGTMYIERLGEEYRGAYSWGGGGVRFTVERGVASGWWTDTAGTGQVEFRIDGTDFIDGRWRHGSSGPWRDSWDLERVADDAPPAELFDRVQDDSFYSSLTGP